MKLNIFYVLFLYTLLTEIGCLITELEEEQINIIFLMFKSDNNFGKFIFYYYLIVIMY